MKELFRIRSSFLLKSFVLLGAFLTLTWADGAVHAEEDYVGNTTCKSCHEDQHKTFSETPHEACEDCHGNGSAHVEGGGDVTEIKSFAGMNEKEANEICFECHKRQSTQFTFNQSMHSLSNVACIDCHTAHPGEDNRNEANLKMAGSELCYSCHAEKEAEFKMPRHHPLPEDGKGCINCHDPHESNNRAKLEGPGNEACFECHAEKEGPFLYEHDVAAVENCSACHEIHGSRNRHLLIKQDERGLCLSCHDIVPGFHGTESIAGWEHGCTPCHQAIHGSNIDPALLEE
ncbi:MAG: cytochrome c3 family protein [Desulfurivibrionaceae bacterium]